MNPWTGDRYPSGLILILGLTSVGLWLSPGCLEELPGVALLFGYKELEFDRDLRFLAPKVLASGSLPYPGLFLAEKLPSQTHEQFAQGQIQVVNGQMVLAEQLQGELSSKIAQAKVRLNSLSQRLSLQFSDQLGIVYRHQGADRWELKFTFGGLLLDIATEISLSTGEVLRLKQRYRQTRAIAIQKKQYMITVWMRQIGPILHTPNRQ
jgi:hypothetical protein